ncbi:D-alanine--D-alanine ligase [Carboxylicivirga sp. M1479]|uniref:D-alanine--D-alanine ligase n=1 Tax=Carboxylicivirga sp. M1479 TaxID=2594476 RepID=UPI0011782ACC|nr:D-alanine--D-alanine ligase [Carboxylicivirga sp. M1479]TRX71564.1 D-alanine--D-alanine ligase [Carboxylicivirga sp. M1479]
MKNIGVIYGGYSSEIIVSEKSKEGVMSFIDETRYNRYPILISHDKWCAVIDNQEFPIDKNDFSFTKDDKKVKIDFAYITIHGTPGEDGLLQGYLSMLNIPHSTCDVQAASISFNKFACNTYLKGFGVAVADSVLVRKGNSYNDKDIVEQLGLPCFVKPNAGGSSFGISKVKEASQLKSAIEKAFTESDEVIIEQFIGGTEVTCGLYKTKGKQEVFPVTEVVSKNEFFDFEAKYTASKVEEITPARIEDAARDRIQSISSLIYDILGCKGIVRIDYIISNNKIFLLEVNTTPGMTVTSFIPQQIEAAGLNIKNVFSEIIENELN